MWRLTSELIAYFPVGKPIVYLASVEKKQHQVEVRKKIGYDSVEELYLYENNFRIRLGCRGDDEVTVYASSNEFPTKDWYMVGNFSTKSLWPILSQHVVENGNFLEDTEFEACFSDDEPGMSTFVSFEMKEYKVYFEEMKRRLNCEMCKKTKKIVPGRRYDTLSVSYYILAPVLYRKSDDTNSGYLDSGTLPEAFLYVESLKEGETKISDVLKNRPFGEIKILTKKPNVVDAGEALEDDFSGNIQDYWKDIFKNTEGIKNTLDIFSVTNTPDIKEELIPREELVATVKDILFDSILNAWDLNSYRSDLFIGSKIDDKDNIERLTKILTNSIKDGNYMKTMYYSGLFRHLGLDLMKLSEEVYHDWRAMSLDHDFDTYLKYNSYYANPGRIDLDKCSAKIRIKSTNYKLDVITLEDLYGKGELRDTIIAVIEEARKNFGLGISEYSSVNVGTKKDPKEYIMCKVTLSDILKFKKGVSGMSETLKDEIRLRHFVWVSVTFDKEGELK